MRLLTCLALLLAACSAEGPSSNAKPAAALTVKPDLRATVQRLTSRGGEGTQMTERPDGTRIYHVTEGLGQVVVAKMNADGTASAKCVESADDTFLDPSQR